MTQRCFFYLILFLALGTSRITHAQSEGDVSKQIWIDVNPSYFINPHFEIFGDIGVRKEIENNGWWRFVVRPSLRKWLGGRFYFTAGIGNFFTFNEIIDNRWELRPFQEQARATLGLDRSFTDDLHYRFEITWQQKRLFFNVNESVPDIYFRFRFTKSWGNRE